MSWPKYSVTSLISGNECQTKSLSPACNDSDDMKIAKSFVKQPITASDFEYFPKPSSKEGTTTNALFKKKNDESFTLKQSAAHFENRSISIEVGGTINDADLERFQPLLQVEGKYEVDISDNTKQWDQHENNESKGCVYRRATGSLRNLIRLHEDEIARASGEYVRGAKQIKVSPKVPKQISIDRPDAEVISKRSSVEKRKSKVDVLNINEDGSTDFSSSKRKPSVNIIPKQPLWPHDKADKCTVTEPDLNEMYTCGKTSELIVEREEEIRRLITENKELSRKLDEQKKVANAYQKLEDRYRKKVYKLEKIISKCTCLSNDNSLFDESVSKTIPRFV
eukprot:gene6410-7141_t